MQNDHKALMKEIEEEMFSIHENGPKISIPVKKGKEEIMFRIQANVASKLKLQCQQM
jgi:hypothetical protein